MEPRGPTRHQGAPTPRARPVALPSGLLPKLLGSLMSREKSSKKIVAFGLRFVLIFWKTKNRQKTATGTRHWVNRLVPKNDIKLHIKAYNVSKIDNIIA